MNTQFTFVSQLKYFYCLLLCRITALAMVVLSLSSCVTNSYIEHVNKDRYHQVSVADLRYFQAGEILDDDTVVLCFC